MIIDWPREFDRQLERIEAAADKGDTHARTVFNVLTYELTVLEKLEHPPTDDTRALKRVRQSVRFTIWRVSHEYIPGVAVRLICWFPDDSDRVVVALFSADKASMGDVFYDSAGSRADALIDRWLTERQVRK